MSPCFVATRSGLLAVLVAAVAILLAPRAVADTRLALVVGVSSYGAQSLANPVRDATLATQALQAGGFKVTTLANPTNGQLRQAVTELAAAGQRSGKDVTLAFYFAGHAVNIAAPPGRRPSDLSGYTAPAKAVLSASP